MVEISGAVPVRRLNQPRNQTFESLSAAFHPKAFLFSNNSASTSTSSLISNSETMADSTSATAALQQLSHTLESLSAALDPKAFLLSKTSTSTSLPEITDAQPPTTHQSNHTTESLFAALDPNALALSQNSTSTILKPLEFTLADFAVERGPRYKAYAELRESKLRKQHHIMMKQNYCDEPESTATPPKKRVMFQETLAGGVRNRTSAVARSVPDFSAVLRKENRKPPSSTALPSTLEMTPPPSKTSKCCVVSSKQGGSKSANAGDKRGGGLMMRKSYASVNDLKGLSSAAASAINGESRGGKGNRGINRAAFGYRQY